MNTNGKAALRGLLAGLPATAIVVVWAKAPLVVGLISWALILLPIAALIGYLAQRLLGDRSMEVGRGLLQVLACVAMGVIATYVEMTVVSWAMPRFLLHPFAASNLVPGVVVGSLVSLFRANP